MTQCQAIVLVVGIPLLWIVAIYVTILEQRWNFVRTYIDSELMKSYPGGFVKRKNDVASS